MSVSDFAGQNFKLYQLHLNVARDLSDPTTTAVAVRHLSEVSEHFDNLLKESGIVMKVQLHTYPKHLLEQVIARVYVSAFLRMPSVQILRCGNFPNLPDKQRARPKLLFAVKSVFLSGLSRNHAASSHR